MQKFLLGCLAAVAALTMSQANAADLPVRRPPPRAGGSARGVPRVRDPAIEILGIVRVKRLRFDGP